MLLYTVQCQFSPDSGDAAERWLRWLRDQHLADVLAGGAEAAEVIELDDVPAKTYEIHYRFTDRAAFDRYLADWAPRLRAEGLELFPLDLGLTYQRRHGTMVCSLQQSMQK